MAEQKERYEQEMKAEGISSFPERLQISIQRTDIARRSLLDDMQRWQKKLPKENKLIRHHVGQFALFCQQAHECLMKGYDQSNLVSSEDRNQFETQVISLLTSQWMLLRQVVSQRLKSSPYRSDLAKLDREAARYYHAIYQALPDVARQQLSVFPPLVQLDRTAELVFFNDQKQKAPALISVPFGVLYDESGQSRLALAHEVGHAIFNRLRSFLPQLSDKIKTDLPQAVTRPQEFLRQAILDWLGEIVADLVGTSLAGLAFGESALFVTVSPDTSMVGITDKNHPVALIRPYIHLQFLEWLDEKLDTDQTRHDGINKLNEKINRLAKPFLLRRFESTPALAMISLEEVKTEMEKIINLILNQSQIKLLGDQTLGEILFTSAKNSQVENEPPDWENIELPSWSEISEEECQQFVLDLSNMLPPDYATPIAFPWVTWCCIRGTCPCS